MKTWIVRVESDQEFHETDDVGARVGLDIEVESRKKPVIAGSESFVVDGAKITMPGSVVLDVYLKRR